jgi:hypothetical protein
MANYVPSGIEKIDRSQFVTYLDVTPNSTATYKILGVGITAYGIDYNPQVDTEKWIIEDNARNDHKSNQKSGSVTQKAYKGDGVFEFVVAGRDKLNYASHILDIDRWDGEGNSFPAKYSDVIIAITKYMDEDAQVEYEIHYNGDPVEGNVTFIDGVPTFTPTSSL